MTTENPNKPHNRSVEGRRKGATVPAEQEGMEGNETPITTLIILKWHDCCRAPYLAAEFVVLKAVQGETARDVNNNRGKLTRHKRAE